MKTDLILTPPQAAAELGVSDATVRRWIDGGLLVARKTPGGHFLITRAALDEFVATMDAAS